jgi:hypothetical protein
MERMITTDGHEIPEVRRAISVDEAEQQVLYFRAAKDSLEARLQEATPFGAEYNQIFADWCEVSRRFRLAVDERTRAKLREPVTLYGQQGNESQREVKPLTVRE